MFPVLIGQHGFNFTLTDSPRVMKIFDNQRGFPSYFEVSVNSANVQKIMIDEIER